MYEYFKYGAILSSALCFINQILKRYFYRVKCEINLTEHSVISTKNKMS